MTKHLPPLPDLVRKEGPFEIAAYYQPSLESEERRCVSVLITLDDRKKHVAEIEVPVEEGWEVFNHPTLYSETFRLLLTGDKKWS